MIFSNQAALSYNGFTVTSNAVSGQLVSPLTLQKAASVSAYGSGGPFRYTVTLSNSSAVAYPGLTLRDDLGLYQWEGFPRFPMAYADDSATLTCYASGSATPGSVTAASGAEGVTFAFDLPPNAVALLSYQVTPTPFAPLAAGATVTNTATLAVPGLSPLSAQSVLPVTEAASLTIAKCGPQTAAAGQTVGYTFTVSNYGNAATQSGDFVTLSDQFSPPLTNLTVSSGGVLWTEGIQYQYDESQAYFQTLPGALQVGAATFAQDSFGRWNVTPASVAVTVTGTVSPAS